jgi:hypothetical protein
MAIVPLILYNEIHEHNSDDVTNKIAGHDACELAIVRRWSSGQSIEPEHLRKGTVCLPTLMNSLLVLSALSQEE